MHIDNANTDPILSIIPFHEIRIITGTSKIKIVERRLRHCVVKSAQSNDDNAADVLGTIVSIFIFYARTVRPVKPMNTSSNVIFPFLETLITSGSFR